MFFCHQNISESIKTHQNESEALRACQMKSMPSGINSPLHVGISLRSALKGTLSGSLSGTLADESWKSPLIEDKKYN